MKSFIKKISVLLAGTMLLGSLSACDSGKWKAKAQEALPAAFDDSTIGTIYCQGEVITFPLKVQDMLDNGFKYPKNIKDIDDETLDSNWSTGLLELLSKNNSSKTVEIKAINIGEETLNLKECWIETMSFTSKSGNVMLPGAIELGQKFDSKEAFEAALPQAFLANEPIGNEYKADYVSGADHYACTMKIKAKESNGKYSIEQVTFESEYYYDTVYFLDSELKAVVHNDSTEYSKIFNEDISQYAKDWKDSAYNTILNLYGFQQDALTDEQYAKFDKFFEKILKDVTWTLESSDKEVKASFSYPNLDEELNQAFEAAIDEYAQTKQGVTVDEMKVDQDLINAFIDKLCATETAIKFENDGSFVFEKLEGESISTEDFSDLVYSFFGLYGPIKEFREGGQPDGASSEETTMTTETATETTQGAA
ncbi:MAG: hypothetical protein IKD90_12345 [Clostridiales bacterium]|nr:hypothetical protein [Clostridiales bacterium]